MCVCVSYEVKNWNILFREYYYWIREIVGRRRSGRSRREETKSTAIANDVAGSSRPLTLSRAPTRLCIRESRPGEEKHGALVSARSLPRESNRNSERERESARDGHTSERRSSYQAHGVYVNPLSLPLLPSVTWHTKSSSNTHTLRDSTDELSSTTLDSIHWCNFIPFFSSYLPPFFLSRQLFFFLHVTCHVSQKKTIKLMIIKIHRAER